MLIESKQLQRNLRISIEILIKVQLQRVFKRIHIPFHLIHNLYEERDISRESNSSVSNDM